MDDNNISNKEKDIETQHTALFDIKDSGHANPGREVVDNSSAKRISGTKGFFIILSFFLIASVFLSAGAYLYSEREIQNVESQTAPSTSINISSTPQNSDNVVTAAEKALPSVVGITIYGSQANYLYQASGVIISEDGYILTNDHIYADCKSPQFLVELYNGEKYDAKYYAGDTRSDLAVLKIEADGLVVAEFGDSDALQIGESVIAVGCPGASSLQSTVTKGIVSGVNRRISVNSNYSMKLIQTDCAINPGNSGGALINIYGQVVGINSSKIVQSGFEGIGFAIPSSTAKSIGESLINNKAVTGRARLGVSYKVIDPVTARQNNIVSGIMIVSVDEDSGLYGKGIGEGDYIVTFNNTEVSEDGNFLDEIDNCSPGQTVQITIRKSDGSDRTLSVKMLEDKGYSSYTG